MLIIDLGASFVFMNHVVSILDFSSLKSILKLTLYSGWPHLNK